MISFKNDYSEICTVEILDRITKETSNQFPGYSCDSISVSAKEKIKKAIGLDNIDVHILVGGTQTNAMIISHMLRPYEAIIAVGSGHINVHESGAIEATGHKVEVCECVNGKPCLEDIEKLIIEREDEHMVLPRAIYISDSTEIGTIYTKSELQALRKLCDKYGLYLFLDGARLGCALVCKENDLTLKDIAELTDIFYIGGTKNGAMMGEAVVVRNDELKKNFRRAVKQRGAMLAKGYLLGIQFDTLFTDNLYFRLAQNAVDQANRLQKELKAIGVEFMSQSPTNQIFPIFTKKQYDELSKNFVFDKWEQKDVKTVYRLVTSWATKSEWVDCFIQECKKLF